MIIKEAAACVASVVEAEALLGDLLGEALAVGRHAPLALVHLRARGA